MSKWIIGANVPFINGEKFEAIVRHSSDNKELFPDRKLFLYVYNGKLHQMNNQELHYLWFIVMFKAVKPKKAK